MSSTVSSNPEKHQAVVAVAGKKTTLHLEERHWTWERHSRGVGVMWSPEHRSRSSWAKAKGGTASQFVNKWSGPDGNYSLHITSRCFLYPCSCSPCAAGSCHQTTLHDERALLTPSQALAGGHHAQAHIHPHTQILRNAPTLLLQLILMFLIYNCHEILSQQNNS